MFKQSFLENTPQQSKGYDGEAFLIWDRHGFLSKSWKSNERFCLLQHVPVSLWMCLPLSHWCFTPGTIVIITVIIIKGQWDLIDTLIFIPCPQERLWFSLIPGTGLLSSHCNRQGEEAGQLLHSLCHTLLALTPAHWLETINHLSLLFSS